MTEFRVALTFDTEHPDRPAEPDRLESILAALARRGVAGTFFIQGRWAEASPGSVRAIADAGHLIGHHSFYHARMPLLTDEGIAEDLADGARALMAAGGPDPAPWFRCPFGAGASDARVLAAIESAGYRHVGWHVDADDWDPNRSEAIIAAEVVAGVVAQGDGAVALFHSWPNPTPGAVEAVVDRLVEHGASFVRIDELAEIPTGISG